MALESAHHANWYSPFDPLFVTVADPGGGGKGAIAHPGPVKISHKKMAAKGGCMDFMFLGPYLRPGHWIRYCVTPVCTLSHGNIIITSFYG